MVRAERSGTWRICVLFKTHRRRSFYRHPGAHRVETKPRELISPHGAVMSLPVAPLRFNIEAVRLQTVRQLKPIHTYPFSFLPPRKSPGDRTGAFRFDVFDVFEKSRVERIFAGLTIIPQRIVRRVIGQRGCVRAEGRRRWASRIPDRNLLPDRKPKRRDYFRRSFRLARGHRM